MRVAKEALETLLSVLSQTEGENAQVGDLVVTFQHDLGLVRGRKGTGLTVELPDGNTQLVDLENVRFALRGQVDPSVAQEIFEKCCHQVPRAGLGARVAAAFENAK